MNPANPGIKSVKLVVKAKLWGEFEYTADLCESGKSSQLLQKSHISVVKVVVLYVWAKGRGSPARLSKLLRVPS